MSDTIRSFSIERRGKITELDRAFDLEFWQQQSPQARFNAAWEMIVHAWRVKGNDVRQLRLLRSVEAFQQQQR
jgi:predicted lipid-binding transport protein (Tim44 family)